MPLKNINLPARYRSVEPLFTDQEHFDEAQELRRLSGRIIAAASAIEQEVADILMATIFREVSDKDLVRGSVLNSDWCTFSAKRKLLLLAVDRFELLRGHAKPSLESGLSRVTHYRNAFAHGHLVHNVDAQELHYFEGCSKVARLDDVYFAKLEADFLSAWQVLRGVSKLLGVETEDSHG